jgi:hypothetical protein
MSWFRRNIFLSVAVPVAAVFILAYGFLAAARNNSTFYLRDIEGDRNKLNGAVITGYLQDRYHGQHFTIRNGLVETRFRNHQDAKDVLQDYRWKAPANGIYHEGKVYWYQFEYEISADAKTHEVLKDKREDGDSNKQNDAHQDKQNDAGQNIRTSIVYADKADVYARLSVISEDFGSTDSWGSIRFDTGIRYASDKADIEFEKQEYVLQGDVVTEVDKIDGVHYPTQYSINRGSIPVSNPGMGMTIMDGDLYFTILASKEYSGWNGIFKAVEFAPWWQAHPDKQGKAEVVVKFSLDEQEIEVLGLETVNHCLALSMFTDGVFTVRLFDRNGVLLDELVLEDVTSVDGLPEYEGYVNDDKLNICLKYRTEDGYYKETVLAVMADSETAGGKKELRLIHKVDRLRPDNESEYHFTVASSDERLYVVSFIKEPDQESGNSIEVLKPGFFSIFVYETLQGETVLVYKGQLVTDADEDFIRDRFKNPASVGYNHYDYRQFEHTNVKVEQE